MQNARFENAMYERGVLDNRISEFDDDEVHIEEHKQFILQIKFRLLEKRYPEYAKAIIDHLKEHQARIDEKIKKQSRRRYYPPHRKELIHNGRRKQQEFVF